MNMWEYLGIEKTKDLGSIKSSYARLLRSHHPEEDPEGFQLLRTAYEFAQRYAKIKDGPDAGKEELFLEIEFAEYCRKNMRDPEADVEGDETADGESETPPEPLQEDESASGNGSKPDTKWIDDFKDKLTALYEDFFARREVSNWENLLKDDLFWNIDKKIELESAIRDFLRVHRNIPSAVWAVLDDEFHWNDRWRDLLRSDAAFANAFRAGMNRDWDTDFSFITRDMDFHYEEYLDCLWQAREAALRKDPAVMTVFFQKAIAIYDKDEQIYRMVSEFLSGIRGGYTVYREEYQLAIDKLIEMRGNNPEYYKMRGFLYSKCEDYDSAREDYLKAFELDPNQLRCLFEVAECFAKEHRKKEALNGYKQIRKIYPRTKISLERQVEATAIKEKLYRTIEENDRIMQMVKDTLKYKFDPYVMGPVLFIIGLAFWVLVAFLFRML